jgi:hypothetical protein
MSNMTSSIGWSLAALLACIVINTVNKVANYTIGAINYCKMCYEFALKQDKISGWIIGEVVDAEGA